MSLDPELDRIILGNAAEFWKQTYRLDKSDVLAADTIRVASLRAGIVSDEIEALLDLATTKWVDCGAPKLMADSKYASALMLSSVDESLIDDLIIPWKAFRVDLPIGLLECGPYAFDHILIAGFEGLPFGGALLLRGRRDAIDSEKKKNEEHIWATVASLGDSLATTLLDREPADEFDVSQRGDVVDGNAMAEHGEQKRRVFRLATRLVVGLLYSLQYTNNFRSVPKPLSDARRNLRSGPPGHRTILFGKPMDTDLSPAVHAYSRGTGRRAPPTVQTLVRGHYKRQVIGVGRTGRKVIWIEPFWRGPEDAPILARPYCVGPKDADQ